MSLADARRTLFGARPVDLMVSYFLGLRRARVKFVLAARDRKLGMHFILLLAVQRYFFYQKVMLSCELATTILIMTKTGLDFCYCDWVESPFL